MMTSYSPRRMIIGSALLAALVAAFVASLVASHPLDAQSHRATQFDPTEKSITELQDAMTSGRVSSAELTSAYLARISAYDHDGPSINAMIRLNPRARADAAALDAERKAGHVRGLMHGIPIVLKDNYDTKDLATSAGSLALVNHVPASDAFIVQRLRDAGAVILGKTNLHELASGITSISSLGGQTLNPYDLSRCPGGSSGGTGAAIAASFAAVGWGTDTCGSIRIPSAFGSLFGLRPTMGMVSRDGIVPLALSQDVAGPMARTATDLAIALDVTVGADPNDAATNVIAGKALPGFRDSLRTDALRGARIGIFKPYFRNADADIADTIRAAARSMRALGAEVIEVDMPDFDDVIAGTGAILYETKFDLVDYFSRPGIEPVKSLGEILEKGLFDKALEARHKGADTATARDSEGHKKVLARQAQLRTRIIAFMDSLHLDAIAYPTSARKPVLAGDPQLGATCALSAQTGLPAITMPAGFTGDGLPTGLELLGRPFNDRRLVQYAYAFEQGGARRKAPPSTPALVNGHAPTPVTFTANAHGVSLKFAFNPLTSELRYTALLVPAQAKHIQAVVLRRADAPRDGTSARQRVIKRILGPGMARVIGAIRLLGDDLDAYKAGRISLAVFATTGVDPVAEIPVQAKH
jgi:amidase